MSEQDSAPPTGHVGVGSFVARYQIVRELGVGGMAVVYEAKHVDLGKRVAIKVLRPAFASDTSYVQRFVLEARAASRFSHPHIITVTDVGVHGDVPYMVMEYLEGHDLATKMGVEGALPLAVVADLALPVISAVAAAHSEGILHRDLKPENIFLAVRGRGRPQPVLLDFGVARPLALLDRRVHTRAGIAVGTPAYMSPEQLLAAADVDERADQYALGVILYKAVTGVFPFSEDTPAALLAAIRRGAPVPSLVVPSLPSEIDAIIIRAISADRSHRFESVRELGRELWPFASAIQQAQWAEEFGDPADVVSRLSSPRISAAPVMTPAPPSDPPPIPVEVSPKDLRALPAFEDTSDAALRTLLSMSRAYRFSPHTTIARQGVHGHGCYLLLSGEVDIVKLSNGRAWVLARLPAGCTFGQIALVDSLPRTASVVAATEAVVVEIGRDAFDKLLAATDEAGETLRLHLAIAGIRHLRRATRRLAGLLDGRAKGGTSEEARRDLLYLQAAVREWALPVDDAVKSEP